MLHISIDKLEKVWICEQNEGILPLISTETQPDPTRPNQTHNQTPWYTLRHNQSRPDTTYHNLDRSGTKYNWLFLGRSPWSTMSRTALLCHAYILYVAQIYYIISYIATVKNTEKCVRIACKTSCVYLPK